MLTKAEQKRLDANLTVIRDYLTEQFPGYVLTEVTDLAYQKFALTNAKLDTHYKVKVVWSRLADPASTPAKIQADLERDDVARHMREANDYFMW